MQGIAPQNRHVKSVAYEFLSVHWDREKPLLLGYSGGPDSKALLYALLDCGVTPHLAHVDHGWRETSAAEAACLKEEADRLGCPFHSIRLTISKSEDEARKARLNYFQSLMKDYSALLLAHQADDLAETVLKRVCEGAHLGYLRGMEPVSEQHGMVIWRPFLSIKKEEILQFLEEKNLCAIQDSSNLDPAYLRARMRLQIFPFLNGQFGKETRENLALLGERAAELKTYLDEKTASIQMRDGRVELGFLPKVEQRHLIQRVSREYSLTLSRDVLETLLDWIEHKKKKHLVVKGWKIGVSFPFLWIQQVPVKSVADSSKTN